MPPLAIAGLWLGGGIVVAIILGRWFKHERELDELRYPGQDARHHDDQDGQGNYRPDDE